MRTNLMRWQYDGYPHFHASRTNLLIHIIAVPTFIACFICFAVAMVMAHWVVAGAALFAMLVAFAAQGVGHKREATPAIPFDGAVDALTRIFGEQLVTFPRFVLSGGYAAALRKDPSQ